MEEKLINLLTIVDAMTEQLTHLTTALSSINDQLQAQQNENRVLFQETSREIQVIQQKLEQLKGDREALT